MRPFEDAPILLTELEQADLQAWVDTAKLQLALSDWSITVSRHETGKDTYASTYIQDHGDVAIIALSPECRAMTAEELRATLVHELLHPHFQRVTRLAERLIQGELGTRAEAIIDEAVQITEEQAIDRLAYAIARWLPLPTALR